MHQPFRRLFPLLILIVLFTGCSIEKRLYTKGWSVERHHRWKHPEGAAVRESEASQEIVTNRTTEAPAVPKAPTAVSEGTRTIVHPAAGDAAVNEAPLAMRSSAVENEEVTDTIYVDEKDIKKAKEWTMERKHRSVTTVSVLLLIVAVSIALFLLVIYAPGTFILYAVFLILLTLVFGMLFFILLVMLLVFAARPAVDKPVRLPEEKTPRERRVEDIRNWILVSVVIAAGIFVLYKLFDQ